jgi:hypothetical protein
LSGVIDAEHLDAPLLQAVHGDVWQGWKQELSGSFLAADTVLGREVDFHRLQITLLQAADYRHGQPQSGPGRREIVSWQRLMVAQESEIIPLPFSLPAWHDDIAYSDLDVV